MSKLSEETDNDLVDLASASEEEEIGGAPVEMIRRLKDATIDQQAATNRLTKGITYLTAVLVVLTIVKLLSSSRSTLDD